MSQHREVTRTVTLAAAGGADNARCWDILTIEPIKNMHIYLSTDGVATAAGDLLWEVFYGGAFNGDPVLTTTQHVGGISQGSGAIAGGTEVLELIHDDGALFPANDLRTLIVNHQPQHDRRGFPIVVYLENDKVAPVTVYVTFISESISERL